MGPSPPSRRPRRRHHRHRRTARSPTSTWSAPARARRPSCSSPASNTTRRHLRGPAGPAGSHRAHVLVRPAGIGDSHPLADDAPDPSPWIGCDRPAGLTGRRRAIDPPYVVLGWSYGGLVAQAYAAAYPEDLAGLVLEDSSVREQFTDPELVDDRRMACVDRRRPRRRPRRASANKLADVRFGDLPVAVLSQDRCAGSSGRCGSATTTTWRAAPPTASTSSGPAPVT